MNESNVNQYSKHMHLIPLFVENFVRSNKGWKLNFVNLDKNYTSLTTPSRQKIPFLLFSFDDKKERKLKCLVSRTILFILILLEEKKFNVLLQNFIITFFFTRKISIFNVWMNLSERAAAENEGGMKLILDSSRILWQIECFWHFLHALIFFSCH